MKVVILYRPNSEYARQVETFITDFRREHDGKIDVVNVDSREGSAMISLYDIVQYPAILALNDDGSLLRSWEGSELPLMQEVSFYAYNGI